MSWNPSCSLNVGIGFGLYVHNVIGPHPGWRTDRQARLGARRQLAGGLEIAAGKGGLCRSKVGIGEIALAAICDGKLRVSIRRFGFARDGRAQQSDRFLGELW